MTDKQKRFVNEYLIDCNATQAAIRAGYSAKTAKSAGQRLLTKVDVKKEIDAKMSKMQDKTITSAEEVIRYLSSVMRGESSSEVVVVEGVGDGCSEARRVQKAPDERERLKAAELLGKRYGIYSDKVNLDGAVPVLLMRFIGCLTFEQIGLALSYDKSGAWRAYDRAIKSLTK